MEAEGFPVLEGEAGGDVVDVAELLFSILDCLGSCLGAGNEADATPGKGRGREGAW